MKKRIGWTCLFLLSLAVAIAAAKLVADWAAEQFLPDRMAVTAVITQKDPEPEETTAQETTVPLTSPPETAPTETEAPIVYDFTAEEETLLLKLAMAERGETGCKECIARVMHTALKRVEGPKFASTIRGVIYAEGQFTPVADGSFERAEPNDLCREALEWIRRGWDESQGALYYEWCEGESWHSRNLQLLTTHCDVRFYK